MNWTERNIGRQDRELERRFHASETATPALRAQVFARADHQRLLATSNTFLPGSLAVELNFIGPVRPLGDF